jgi:hypothetical protein
MADTLCACAPHGSSSTAGLVTRAVRLPGASGSATAAGVASKAAAGAMVWLHLHAAEAAQQERGQRDPQADPPPSCPKHTPPPTRTVGSLLWTPGNRCSPATHT